MTDCARPRYCWPLEVGLEYAPNIAMFCQWHAGVKMSKWLTGLFLGLVLGTLSSTAFAGRIFVTGHDPIWHAQQGSNSAGATNLAQAGINFAVGSSALPFLFVESITTAVPSGNLRTAPFLTSALGYATTDYQVIDGAGLTAVADLATFLTGFSAIVVASDHGGMLTAAELSVLNANSATILDFLNAGGGLYAEAESNAKGLIGTETRFGFLPFLVSSADFGAAESGNTVTAFGASQFGLTNSDVNGNFSHNYFMSTGGMSVVDLFNNDPARPLTLAFDGLIGDTGVVTVPEPGTLGLLGAGLLGLFVRRKLVA